MAKVAVRRSAVAAVLVAVSVTAALLASTGCRCVREPEPRVTIRIGTLATEDALPLWVAALSNADPPSSATTQGLAQERGIDLKMVTFSTAQERDAALTAGEIDGFVGDIITAAALSNKGTAVKIVAVMLGADPTEGRCGIVVPRGSKVTAAVQLAGVPIATAPNTTCDYVTDRLLMQEGLSFGDIKKVAVKGISTRADLLLAGKVKAAELPDPQLFYAEQQGARLVIDDTKGQNLSQTVLVIGDRMLKDEPRAVARLLDAEAAAAKMIDEDPERYRALLVDKAKLPPPIATTYRLNVYPEPQPPSKEEVESVLAWMAVKGLLTRFGSVTYSTITTSVPAGR